MATDFQDYDPAKHCPVFYGRLHEKISITDDLMPDADPAMSHPAVLGHALVERPPASPPASPPPLPPHETCEILQNF